MLETSLPEVNPTSVTRIEISVFHHKNHFDEKSENDWNFDPSNGSI